MTPRRPAIPDMECLLALLRRDDVDTAIEAGLMDCDPDGLDDARDRAVLATAQGNLRNAWAARDRFRARNSRLAHRKAERKALRPDASGPRTANAPLPPAAAAALARAKAKAARKP
jgi:hypothetical protein